MKYLLALLALASCTGQGIPVGQSLPATMNANDTPGGIVSKADTPGGLIPTDATLTVTVHDAMPASAGQLAFFYAVYVENNCLYPPGFSVTGGQSKSMSGSPSPSCYPITIQINNAFFNYYCTLTVTAPGAYSVKHGPLANCSIEQQSQSAVTVDYGQILLGPNYTPIQFFPPQAKSNIFQGVDPNLRVVDRMIRVVNEYKSTPAAFLNNQKPPAITVCSLVSPCLPGMPVGKALLQYQYGNTVLASNFPWQPDETCVLYRGHIANGKYTHCYFWRRTLHYRLTPPA